ncbi:MAG: DUF4337 domain-containing protein [Rhizomicrobium sp.]
MELELKAENARLNAYVAVTVAILAVITAIGNIKNSNVAQQMSFTKGNSVDVWNEYQATRIKLHTDENAIGAVSLAAPSDAGPTETRRLQAKIAKYNAGSKELMEKAKAEDEHYEILDLHHEQLDMAEAFNSIGVSLAAVAALTDFFWLLCVSWGFGACGVTMAALAFVGSTFHPDFLMRWLT